MSRTVLLEMTEDQARKMSQYLGKVKPWPDWEFPGLEVKYRCPDPDVDNGELRIVIKD